MKIYEAFLAVSYGPACVEGSSYRRTIESLLDLAQTARLSIYAAPFEEKWGLLCPTRQDAIACDHAAMHTAPAFLFFTGGFESDGALVELGMALALKKNILIMHYKEEILSSHVKGLIDIGLAQEITLGSDEQLVSVVETLGAISSGQTPDDWQYVVAETRSFDVNGQGTDNFSTKVRLH
jgi:hypothetical protein